MKKNTIYVLFIIVFAIAIIGIIFYWNKQKAAKEKAVYELIPRKNNAQNAEWKMAKAKADSFMAIIKADPTDAKTTLKLAALYIQEARESGNYIYYDVAAMKQVNNVLKIDSLNFNALVFKSLIFLSQHHFAEGLEIAKKAQAVNPYNNYVYGLLVDANVEMGLYDSAVANSDRMINLRPDLTSYSRASYLREIYGNLPSSIEAMQLAVDAGGKGDEHTEWSRVHLASLYEKIGNYKKADTIYKVSLVFRPDYPYALVGLGRVALAGGDYPKALSYFLQADSLITDNTLKEDLVEVYTAMGNKNKATEIAKAMIEELSQDAKAGDTDDNIGHYADRELAYAYLNINENDNALTHAQLEYNRRPDNIDVNETLAWVYYQKANFDKAMPYIKVALKTNSKNPILLARAGLIYFKNGEKATAKTLLQQATENNSYLGHLLKEQVANAQKEL